MKKTILVFAFIIFCFSNSFAQLVPNAGLENWVTYPLYEEPVGWTSQNGGYPVYTVTKSTDSCLGFYSAQIRNDTFTTVVGSLDTLQGLLITGTNLFTGQIGFPWALRAFQMRACIKYTRMGNDSAELNVKMTKYNTVSHITSDVTTNFCYKRIGTSSAVHYVVTVPITYINGSVYPDTAIISFSPSAFNSGASVTPWSSLWVDNVILDWGVGQTEIFNSADAIKVYPNPAKDEINFSSLPPDAARIRLLDITGREAAGAAVDNPKMSISLKNLSRGIYIYEIRSVENKTIAKGKISVVE